MSRLVNLLNKHNSRNLNGTKRKVLFLIRSGFSLNEISNELGLSHNYVKKLVYELRKEGFIGYLRTSNKSLSKKVTFSDSEVTRGVESNSIPMGNQIVVGLTEYNIIKFGRLCHTFTISHVVAHYHSGVSKEERKRLYKRYYSAVQRLERRGLIKRVSRGVYQFIVIPLNCKVIDTRSKNVIKRNKFTGVELDPPVASRHDCIFGSLEDLVRSNRIHKLRLRFHSSIETMESDKMLRILYLRIVFAKEFTKYLEEVLGKYFSRRDRQKIRRIAKELANEVIMNQKVRLVGAHGVYNEEGKLVRDPNDGLIPLEKLEGVLPKKAREIGVDIVFDSDIDFEELINHIKIYVERLDQEEDS